MVPRDVHASARPSTPRHLVALLGTAAVLLAGCTVVVPGTAAPAPGARPYAPPPDAAASPVPPVVQPAPSRPTAPAPSAKPLVTGWNTVRSTQRAALYDVPASWTVNSEDTIVGFGTRNGQVVVAASGSASLGQDACGRFTSLATSVVKHSTSSDLAEAARLEARQWADAGFLDAQDRRPTLRTGPPQTVTTLTGKRAVVVKVSAAAASSIGPCGQDGAAWAVAATGFSGRLGPTAILVVVASSGFANAVPEPQIRQILTTLRPEG